MTLAITALMAVTTVLLLTLLVLAGWRRPLAWPFAAYAGAMTLGSALTLPFLPAPFDTVATVLGLVAAVSLVGYLLLSGGPHRPLHRSVAPFALLLGVAALSTLWSRDPARTLQSVSYLAAIMILFGLAIAVPVERRDLRIVERAMILGGVATAVYALWQVTQGELGGASNIPRLATVGSEGGPNATSAALLLPLLLSLSHAESASHRFGRRAAFAAAVLIGVTIVLAGSRGGLAGAAVGVAVAVIVHPHRVRYLRILSGLALAGAVAFTVAPQGLIDHLQKRDSTGRAQIWEVGVRACSTYCVAGSGYATFGDVYLETLTRDPVLDGHRLRPYQAHNVLLGQLIEIGIVGLVLTIVALWWVLRDAGRLPRRWRGPPLAALVGLLVSNLFLSHFEFRYFWLVLTYAVLVVNVHTRDGDAQAAAVTVPSVSGGPR